MFAYLSPSPPRDTDDAPAAWGAYPRSCRDAVPRTPMPPTLSLQVHRGQNGWHGPVRRRGQLIETWWVTLDPRMSKRPATPYLVGFAFWVCKLWVGCTHSPLAIYIQTTWLNYPRTHGNLVRLHFFSTFEYYTEMVWAYRKYSLTTFESRLRTPGRQEPSKLAWNSIVRLSGLSVHSYMHT